MEVRIARIATVPESFVPILESVLDLRKNGFAVDIICSPGAYGEYLRKEHHFNVIDCEIPRGISLTKDFVAVLKLAKILIKNRYDIIHSHTPKAGLISAIAGVLAFRKIRLHTFTGQRWVTIKRPLKDLLRFLDWLVVRLNTRCYADSPSQVEFLIEQGVATKKSVHCLGEGSFGGVPYSKFANQNREKNRNEIGSKHQMPVDQPWALFVGRIVKDKGINELITAFQIANKKQAFQLILVGPFEDAQDPISPETREIILNSPNIHHLGFQLDPGYFMAACDFLCLPSHREGFGSVVIEAAACGIPAIGTKISGLRDAIIDQKTGVLVPVDNVPELTKVLVMFAADENLRQKMGKEAQQRASEKFNSELMSRLQIQEYRNLLN